MEINLLYRPSQTVAQCWLEPGESLLAETGAMMGMSTNIEMQTQSGGMLGGLKRMLAGESFYRNTFTAAGSEGEVLLTTPLAGDMEVLSVGERQWCLANRAFVASTPDVQVEAHPLGRGLFAGAGLFVLSTSGSGRMIVGSFGALEELQVDGSLVIDSGHLVAWDAQLEFQVMRASPSGWLASWLSGEGLVCRFQGRGRLFLQSRNLAAYGTTLGALLPPLES